MNEASSQHGPRSSGLSPRSRTTPTISNQASASAEPTADRSLAVAFDLYFRRVPNGDPRCVNRSNRRANVSLTITVGAAGERSRLSKSRPVTMARSKVEKKSGPTLVVQNKSSYADPVPGDASTSATRTADTEPGAPSAKVEAITPGSRKIR